MRVPQPPFPSRASGEICFAKYQAFDLGRLNRASEAA